jgi:hypothetical protein
MTRMARPKDGSLPASPRPGTGISRPGRPKNLPVYPTRIATLEIGEQMTRLSHLRIADLFFFSQFTKCRPNSFGWTNLQLSHLE